MSDITKRLRQPLEGYPHGSVQSKLFHEAADCIEKLEAQLEAANKNAAFYRSCALSGEIPKEGSEPSALNGEDDE